MHIAVIATTESPTLLNHIRPAFEARGHVMDVAQLDMINISDLLANPAIQDLSRYDAVYYRTGLDCYGVELVYRYLVDHQVPCINFAQCTHPYILRKQYQVAYVGAHGVRVPRTYMASVPDHTANVAALGVPYIAKADESAQGRDVHAIHTEKELEELAPLWGEKNYLLQEFILHSFDYRMHVVDGSVVTPYRRLSPEGDFRTNVSRGGSMEPVEEHEYDEVSEFAVRAAALFACDVCAIDLIRSEADGQLYFVELNTNPGWLGVRELFGADPSEAVVELIERRVGVS